MAAKRAWIAGVLVAASGAVAQELAPLHEFLSRPDLKVPRLFVDSYNASAVAPGYIFLSPFYPELHPGSPIAATAQQTTNFDSAPLIYDNQGVTLIVIWYGRASIGPARTSRLDASSGPWGLKPDLDGERHLCFGHYHPEAPIHRDVVNRHYELVHSVWSHGDSNGVPFKNDTHEFNVKPAQSDRDLNVDHEHTAIISSRTIRELPEPIYHPKCDLNISWLQSSVFQEVKLSTNKVIFQWDSIEHIPIEDSHCGGRDRARRTGKTSQTSWDHFHLNAVDRDLQGDYYLSGRHTSTLYKVSGRNGSILWSVGERGTFEMISEVDGIQPTFGFQHHLRLQEEYPGYDVASGRVVLSLFDNANDQYDFTTKIADFSSGKVFLIDERQRTAVLKEAYTLLRDPRRQLSTNQGSFQLLPNGNRILGGGNIQEVIEWQPSNPEPVFLAHWGDWERPDGSIGHKINSYRSLRFDWHGFPRDSPAIFAFASDCGARLTSYMSWNGATEVAQWAVWGGAERDGSFLKLGSTERTGFESRVSSAFAPYVFAVALDGEMNELGRSRPTRVAVPNAPAEGEVADLPCGADRCEPDFDYAARASRECSPTSIPAHSDQTSSQILDFQQQEAEGTGSAWRHCDPCFGHLEDFVA